MKNSLYIIGIFATMLLGGCTKSDLDSQQLTDDGAVNFRVSISDQSRVVGNVWETGDKVGIFTQFYINRQWEIQENAESGELQLEAWDDNQKIFASQHGAQGYYAYYPFDGTLASFDDVIELDLSGQFIEEVDEFLWASVAPTLDMNIDLVFERPLTRVVFNLGSYRTDLGELKDCTITLKNVAVKGDFSVMDGTISNVELGDMNIDLNGDNASYDTDSERYAIELQLLPMADLSGVTLTVEGGDGKVYEVEPTDTSWDGGVSYNYGSTFGDSGLFLSDFSADMTLPISNTWYIMDESATGRADFEALHAALDKAEEADRDISLVFPNMNSIPSNAFTVTEGVGGSIFAGLSVFSGLSLVSISCPRVTTVGELAFTACQNLTSVDLPIATDFGVFVFGICRELKTITLPSAEIIGAQMFNGCHYLESVSLPAAKIVGISEDSDSSGDVFSGCQWLEYINIGYNPAGGHSVIEAIDKNWIGGTFIDATKIDLYLGNITNAQPAISIGSDKKTLTVDSKDVTFKSITQNLSAEDLIAGRLPIEDTWVIEDTEITSSQMIDIQIKIYNAGRNNDEISLKFPYLTAIPDNFFNGSATWLVSIDCPEVTSIGSRAFENSSNLKEINFPNVTSIGSHAFHNTAITEADFPEVNGVVGKGAFDGCTSLTSVNLPNATELDEAVFKGCSQLTTIELKSVTTVERYAFQNCILLASATLPKATTVGQLAFAGCSALTILNIGYDEAEVAHADIAYIDPRWYRDILTTEVPLEINLPSLTLKIGNTDDLQDIYTGLYNFYISGNSMNYDTSSYDGVTYNFGLIVKP